MLKLPGDGDSESESSSSLSVKVEPGRSRRQQQLQHRQGEEAAPPGYMQSLINKIISNVSIVCNNLILKYVEDDIVLSLNVRNLCVSSADVSWEPAFTELGLPHLILRKLVRVTDLTVCLDRRNASGKIEHYQEPLLYRCSLSIHAAWCYDSPHSKIPTVSRYEVKCQKLDFSLTDTQIPMFVRIAKLALALYYGQIAKRSRKEDAAPQSKTGDDSGAAAAGQGDGHGGGHGGGSGAGGAHEASWSGWAWNVGSSVGSALLPVYWEDDEDFDVPKIDIRRDLVFHAGLYVESATLVLKRTELLSDGRSLFGSTKQCFSPFLRLDCSGIFQEIVVRGMGLVNVSAGVSELRLEPVGCCPCGVNDVPQQQQQQQQADQGTPYVSCGSPGQKNFLKGSLFERSVGNEEVEDRPVERQRSYKVDWDDHLECTSEEKMLLRTPAFAMDYLYCLEIPSEYTSEQLSEIGCDLEYSDLSERALCRFVFGPSLVRICSGFVHCLSLASHFAAQYDYVPYR